MKLFFGRTENGSDGVQHGIYYDLEGFTECDVCQFVRKKEKDFAKCTSGLFTGPMRFVSFDEERRHPFMGRKVFPSVQPSVIKRYPLRYRMDTWSKTREPSSVLLQLVLSNRLSSMTKAFTRSFPVSGSTASATFLDSSVVKRSQFVLGLFKKR